MDLAKINRYEKFDKEYNDEKRKMIDIYFSVKEEKYLDVCKMMSDKGYAFFKRIYSNYLLRTLCFNKSNLSIIKKNSEEAFELGCAKSGLLLASYYEDIDENICDYYLHLSADKYEITYELLKAMSIHEEFDYENLSFFVKNDNDKKYLDTYSDFINGNFWGDRYMHSNYFVKDNIYNYKLTINFFTRAMDLFTKEIEIPNCFKNIEEYEYLYVMLVPSYDLKKLKVVIVRLSERKERFFTLNVGDCVLIEEKYDV